MRKNKFLIYLLLVAILLCSLSGCAEVPPQPSQTETQSTTIESTIQEVDYAGSLELDMESATLKQEVTVKLFIDGDTTHFHVPTSVNKTGVLKARYLSINTPESTGKIEEYGKKASAFTKEKLSTATSIIIESEDGSWNADSTGDRYLVWVWYKPEGSDTYRNLNVEILQNGLAIANSSANSRYGSACTAAITQAKAQKLNIYSGQPDPDFYYGGAVELTLRELRTKIETYNGVKVAFSGVVTVNDNNSVYVESYDPETDMYYGMSVYYGYNLNGLGLDILNVGNEVRIVGSVQYYEAGGTWQVSDLNYRMMKPDDPNNIQKLSEGHQPAYVQIEPSKLEGDTVEIPVGEEMVTMDYAKLIMSTSVEMKDLYVYDAYTTKNESSASLGAMTLYCQAGGHRIAVRTIVLYDENGQLVTQDRFLGKTIDVKGLVDYFDGDYQIKVFNINDITIHE
jgi:endonuclease YncB( thermonuclease family)